MIQAKFKCSQVNKFESGEQAHLMPVHSDSEENKTFARNTPSGKLELMITNPIALGYFEPGQEYLLDIKKAPK